MVNHEISHNSSSTACNYYCTTGYNYPITWSYTTTENLLSKLQSLRIKCPKCNGEGKVFTQVKGNTYKKEDCQKCRGWGYLLTTEGMAVMREMELLSNLWKSQAY